jgi:hypothetical protein
MFERGKNGVSKVITKIESNIVKPHPKARPMTLAKESR